MTLLYNIFFNVSVNWDWCDPDYDEPSLWSTGDQGGQIHFEGYQVSNVCMALVRDDILIPTKDAPELGYVKESSNEQFVPDVFYTVRTQMVTICVLFSHHTYHEVICSNCIWKMLFKQRKASSYW